MSKAPMSMPQVLYDTIHMQGGMDEMTPLLDLPTGAVRDSLNFEASILGGYSRIAGYERYDGQPLPSTKTHSIIYIDAFINVPAVGNTITGQTSAATAYVLAADTNYLVVSEITGVFVVPEVVKVGATLIGNTAVPSGTITPLQRAVYVGLASDRQRTHIGAVPGSGPIRGVFVYNDLVYAFRDNAGGTATALYVESAAGWVLVPYMQQVYFTAGTTVPKEGTTIHQGAVTGVLRRAALQTGVWAGSAAGKLVFDTLTGGNFAAGAATVDNGGGTATTLTLSGVQTSITFATGGKFEFEIGNFSGQSTSIRVYGCDGANKCFEFDGVTLVPIDTGFTPDTPKHISIHKNLLFVGVLASLGYSSPGLPYNWDAGSGAGVIAVGDNITNILELPGAQTTAAMGVWTRSTTFILYGIGASGGNTFNLVPLNTGCGAIHYTAENMAHTYVMDDRGVVDMQETLNYGNFDIDTITYRVNNFIELKRARTSCSVLNRHKSQYRIFFTDGYGLYITNMHGQYASQNVTSAATRVLFPNPVNCIYEAKMGSGAEVIYFGSTDSNGFVYKLDSGSSFDGAAIDYYLTFGYNGVGANRMLKRYRHAQLEAFGTSFFQFNFGYTLGYGATQVLQPNYASTQNNVVLPFWDAFTWDAFTWDGTSTTPQEVEMNGTAENYALSIKGSSAIFYAFNINSATVHYTNRRGIR